MRNVTVGAETDERTVIGASMRAAHMSSRGPVYKASYGGLQGSALWAVHYSAAHSTLLLNPEP